MEEEGKEERRKKKERRKRKVKGKKGEGKIGYFLPRVKSNIWTTTKILESSISTT